MRRFYLSFLIIIISGVFSASLFSQTTLIDPAGAGGFELGATPAANGWTALASGVDQWIVGSGSGVSAGTNAGFISNDNTNWTYSQLSVIQHLYYDVTIPAGENKVTLTFKWKVGGEGANTSDWDNMKVFWGLASAITPVANTAIGSAFQISGPGAVSGMYKLNSAAYNTETIVISGIPGSTYRLVFSWKSDVSTIANPPAAIDEVSLVSSVPGNYVSVSTGDWNSPATWGTTDFPTPADNATVSSGHTVTINALNLGANNLTINGTCTFNTTATTMIVNGDLTVNAGGIFNVFNSTTGKRLNLFGNLTNNGTIDLSVGAASTATNGVLNLSGTGVQTVGGSGVWTSNIIRNLIMSNTSTVIPNVIWNFNNLVVQHNLNLTGARIDLNGNTILSGNAANGTTDPTRTFPSGTGFMNGIYGRWWTTGQTGTTAFTAGSDPTSATSQFPFVNSAGQNRSIWIRRTSSTTTGNTAGYLRVQYNDATGISPITSVDDGGYMLNRQFNGNWTITTDGVYVYASGTHQIATVAPSAYLPANANTRLMYQSSVTGTHEPGTITPGGKRFALTTAQLTGGNWYMAINNNDLPISTVAIGLWDNPAIWDSGTVPTCNDATVILHRVTVNSTGNVAKGVNIGANGRLIISSGDLTVDACTPRADARFDIGAGRFEMQGGTLTVRGSFRTLETPTGVFQQTGGDIIVDGNNGTLAESVASHIVDLFVTNTSMLDLTGGTFTVVDPPLSTTSTNCAFKVYPYAALNVSSGTGWQLNLGNGSVTNNGGHTSGYLLNLVGLSSAAFKIGNLRVNTGIGGTNRHINTTGNLPLTNLTVTSGEYRTGSTHFISGDILVETNGTLSWTGTVNFSDWSGSAGIQGSVAQQITNNGTIRNSTTTTTANLSSLTMNNTGGLTLNSPLTMSGTLLMTKGIINTTSTNSLRLGTITAAATLSTSSVFANDTHINGPVMRTLGTATASNTFDNLRLYPTGKGGIYYPIWLSPTTTAPTIFTAEAFADMPGTPGPGVSNLADNRWVISADLPANVTAAHIQLGDADIVSTRQILQAPTANGAYSGIVTGTLFTAGTPNTIKTNPNGSPIPNADFTGFFSYGDLVPCIAPAAQPTSLMFSGVSSTSLIGMFTPASPAADGYLVVRYPTGATPVDPVNGTAYAPGGTLGTGTVVAFASNSTFNVTGLTASTTYDFYVYSYNAIGCGGGPVYLTTGPLFGMVTTCSTVVNPITGLITTGLTQTSLNIQWMASTTPGVSYFVDVASDASFTNILQFNISVGTATTYLISGLAPGTTYHFRVRAFDSGSGCFSTNLAASNRTLCSGTNTPYLENLNGSVTCLSSWISTNSNAWSVGSAPTTPSGMSGNTARVSSSTSNPTSAWYTTRALNLTGGTSYLFKFKYGNTTSTATLSLEVIYSEANPGDGGIVFANNVVMGTINDVNNTMANTANFSFTPPNTAQYYLMVRAIGPVASSTSTVHIDDLDVDLTPQCVSATGGTISSSASATPCGNANTTTLNASGYTYSLNMSYQWEKSTDNISWSNMGTVISHPAQPDAPFVSDVFTPGNNYFRLRAVCGNGPVTGYSNVIGPIVYSNPQPLTTTGGSRCGTGTVDLSCTVNMGDDAAWYANPTGGAPLGVGTSFTTPIISTTTNYYVAAISGGINEQAARPTYSGTDNTTGTQWGLVFDVVSSAITINSVDVFSVGAGGSLTIELRDNAGNLLLTSAVASYPPGTTGSPVQVTIPVGFNVPVGTGYRLVMGSMGGNLIRNSSLGGFPYTSNSGNVVVTSGYISGTSTTYYWFYNWNVTSGCEGTRTVVTATVSNPPALTLSSNAETICEGLSTPLITITSPLINYNTYDWSPAMGVSGDENNGYMFNPTTSTTYTLTASQTSPPMCSNTAQVVVTVNPRPNILSATATPATVNCGDDSQLDVSVSNQIKDYSFGTSTGNTLDPMTGATTIVSSSVDDTPSAVTPIGFNFVFDGVSYADFAASPDGWVKLGTGTVSNQFTNAITSTTNIPKLYPYWDDLATGTNGHVRYVVNGTAPNRILVVEWFVTIPRATAGTANSTFQAWLYEGTNVVEFRYGAMGSGSMTSSLGLSGNTPASNFNCITVSSHTNSTTTANDNNAGQPESGRMYTFTPKTFSYAWAPTTYLNNPNIRNPLAENIGADITYNVVVTDVSTGCSRTSDDVDITTQNCNVALALTAYIEGFMDGGSMRPVLLNSGVMGATASQADTITVSLHNNTAPYAKAYEYKGVLGTNGTMNCTFPAAANGGNYYIVVTHRSALETWSASPMIFSPTNTYSFASGASQAFGSNMVQVGSNWCLFSGDIDAIPADGNVDLIDYPIWETDYNNLEVGYFRSDLNGDGSVDLIDYPIWETNYNNLISVIKP